MDHCGTHPFIRVDPFAIDHQRDVVSEMTDGTKAVEDRASRRMDGELTDHRHSVVLEKSRPISKHVLKG